MKEDIDENYLEEGDVYSQENRQQLVEDDEISPEEEAFMEGWEEGWNLNKLINEESHNFQSIHVNSNRDGSILHTNNCKS